MEWGNQTHGLWVFEYKNSHLILESVGGKTMSTSAAFGLSATPRSHTSVMENTPRPLSTDAACCEITRRMEVVGYGPQKLTLAPLASPRSDGIIGSSGALKRVLEKVSRVAPTDATVLITGE